MHLRHFLEGTGPVSALLRYLMVSLGGSGLPQLDHSWEHRMNNVHLHLTDSTHGDGGTRRTTQARSKPRNCSPPQGSWCLPGSFSGAGAWPSS